MGAVSSSARNQLCLQSQWRPWELHVEDCSSRIPCIDGKYCSGDVFRLVAEKELDRVGDIVDVCQSLERTAAHDLLPLLVC